jgi:hypothetical protein
VAKVISTDEIRRFAFDHAGTAVSKARQFAAVARDAGNTADGLNARMAGVSRIGAQIDLTSTALTTLSQLAMSLGDWFLSCEVDVILEDTTATLLALQGQLLQQREEVL